MNERMSKYLTDREKAELEAEEAQKTAQDWGTGLDVAANTLNLYNQSQKPSPVILNNRMQDLGKPQTVIESEDPAKVDFSVAKSALNATAKNKADKVSKVDEGFDRSLKMDKAGKEMDLDDPQSRESQMTRAQYKTSLYKLAKEADQVGDKEASAQFMAQAQGTEGLSANQAMQGLGLIKNVSYRDALDALRADKQFNASREDRNEERAWRRQDRKDLLQARKEDKEALAEAKKEAAAEKNAEKMETLRVGNYGFAQTPDDAKQLKEASESKKAFDGKLDELIELRKKHGGGAVLNREDVARAKQLSKDLLLDYKNMAKLGVLSKSDEDIINAIIPSDPLQYRGVLEVVQGQDSILNNMQKFKSDSDRDFKTKLGNRLRREGRKESLGGGQGGSNTIDNADDL